MASERVFDVCRRLSVLSASQCANRAEMSLLIASMVFEVLRSKKWHSVLNKFVRLTNEEIRTTLLLWKHRQLFSAVDALFEAIQNEEQLLDWQTLGGWYRELVTSQTFEQSTACSPVCSTIALRYVVSALDLTELTLLWLSQLLIFFGRMSKRTDDHVDSTLIGFLKTIPTRAFADNAKLGLHLEFYCHHLYPSDAPLLWNCDELDKDVPPSTGVLVGATADKVFPFGGLDSRRLQKLEEQLVNCSLITSNGNEGSLCLTHGETTFEGGGEVVAYHVNLKACNLYADWTAYDVNMLLVACTQLEDSLLPAPAILNPRTWLLAMEGTDVRQLAYNKRITTFKQPLVVLCPSRDTTILDCIVISISADGKNVRATVLGKHTNEIGNEPLGKRIKNIVQAYTTWDKSPEPTFFTLESSVKYAVVLGPNSTTTATMLASLFEHLCTLGCPKYQATLDSGTTYVTTSHGQPLRVIKQWVAKIKQIKPLASPVHRQTLDDEVSETLLTDVMDTTGDLFAVQSAASSSAGFAAPPSSDQLLSASSSAPASPATQLRQTSKRSAKTGQTYPNERQPKHAKARRVSSKFPEDAAYGDSMRGAISCTHLLKVKEELLDPLYVDEPRRDIDWTDEKVKGMQDKGPFRTQMAGYLLTESGMKTNLVDLSVLHATSRKDEHALLGNFLQPVVHIAAKQLYGEQHPEDKPIVLLKMDRIGTSEAPEHRLLHGHESVMEAVRWAYDDPAGKESAHVLAIVYLRPTTATQLLDLEYQSPGDDPSDDYKNDRARMVSCWPAAARQREQQSKVRLQGAGTFVVFPGTQLLQDVIGMENQASMRHRVLDPARKNVARSLDGYEDDESAINSHRDILVMVFGKPDSTRKAVSREITGQLLLQCNGRPEKYCNFPRSCRSPLRHVEHYPVVRYANWIRTPVPLAMSVDVGRAEEVRRVLTTFAVEYLAVEGLPSFKRYLAQLTKLCVSPEDQSTDPMLKCLSSMLPCSKGEERTKEREFGEQWAALFMKVHVRLVAANPALRQEFEHEMLEESAKLNEVAELNDE